MVLAKAIGEADRTRLPMRLEYLKWNPVGSLYERHGFLRTGENDTHYFMERKSPDEITCSQRTNQRPRI